MIKIIKDIEDILDFSWKLTRDDKNASYPRPDSIAELKEFINPYINDSDKEALGYYENDKLSGVCLYFWIAKDSYVQTKLLLIEGDYFKALDEIFSHIKNKCPAYEFLIPGVPLTNNTLNEYFLKRDIECIESSIVTKLTNPKSYPINLADLNEITKDNFKDYAPFHDKFALPIEMYFNSKNLEYYIDNFRILTLKEDGLIYASIFAKVVENTAEIFGLFFDSEYKNKRPEKILINQLLNTLYEEFPSLEHISFFIDENADDELESALELGFEIEAKYKCYKINF